MAIYHLTAAVVSRGNGHSSTAKAAYNARMRIEDERTGIVHDYSRHKSPVLWTGLYTPKDAPDWTRDRAQLWNHVEAFEKHRSAQVARTIEISLPHELTLEQQRYALQDFIRENFTRKDLIADAAIHAPAPGTDDRNVHAHIMFVTRKLDGTEFSNRKADRADSLREFKANQLAELEGWRESWEKIGNRHLARHGHEPTLDRRTLEAQQIDRTPGVHQGKKARQMEARGIQTDRGDMAREAANQNEARQWIAQQVAEAEAQTLDQLKAEQQQRDAKHAAERATMAAENRPQHRAAETTKDKPAAPQRIPQDAPQRSAERMIARALDELAQTDPVRFAAAAAAAHEAHLQRPAQSWTGLPASAEAERRRDIEDKARAAMERAEARWKIDLPKPATPTAPAPQRTRVDYLAVLRQQPAEQQPAPFTAEPVQTTEPAPVWQRLDYLSRIPKAPQQPQEPGRAELPKVLATPIAGTSSQAIQRPSYEVDSSQQTPQAPEISLLAALVAAGRERLAELAGRMERALLAVLAHHEDRTRPALLPPAAPERSTRDLAAENRATDPAKQRRPAERVRSYPVPQKEQPQPASDFEQRKAEANRKNDELLKPRPIDEADRRRRQLERDRDHERELHHRPFLRDLLGYIRKHHHRRHGE